MFDKEKYWERRKKGLQGQEPGTEKELQHDMRVRVRKVVKEKGRDTIVNALKKAKNEAN